MPVCLFAAMAANIPLLQSYSHAFIEAARTGLHSLPAPNRNPSRENEFMAKNQPTSPTALAPKRPWHFDATNLQGVIPLLTPTGAETGLFVHVHHSEAVAIDTAELVCQWSIRDAGEAA